ncbi:DNA ligase (ATP) [Burkholderia ambifaria]
MSKGWLEPRSPGRSSLKFGMATIAADLGSSQETVCTFKRHATGTQVPHPPTKRGGHMARWTRERGLHPRTQTAGENGRMPEFIEPSLAVLAEEPPTAAQRESWASRWTRRIAREERTAGSNSNRQELVIGGFSRRKGATGCVRAVLRAVYEEGGLLRYVKHVVPHFTPRQAREFEDRLAALGRKRSPFVRAPKPEVDREFHWVKPELVAEVAFLEWPPTRQLRHPSFRGLRVDKPHGA